MSYGKRYAGDPRWITARFGHCAKCNKPLAGKRAAYFPNGNICYCEDCGRPIMAQFHAEAFDEAVMTGNW